MNLMLIVLVVCSLATTVFSNALGDRASLVDDDTQFLSNNVQSRQAEPGMGGSGYPIYPSGYYNTYLDLEVDNQANTGCAQINATFSGDNTQSNFDCNVTNTNNLIPSSPVTSYGTYGSYSPPKYSSSSHHAQSRSINPVVPAVRPIAQNVQPASNGAKSAPPSASRTGGVKAAPGKIARLSGQQAKSDEDEDGDDRLFDY